jgi:hypothetical protein
VQFRATGRLTVCRPYCENTLGQYEQPFYSNLPQVALYWITVLSCGESNPEAGTLLKFRRELFSATLLSKESLFNMRNWVRWPVWLCLSLMLWMAAAESVHNHPTQTEAAACSICVAAHSASPTIITSHATPILATVGLLLEEDVVAKAWLNFRDAGIRGPPVL